MILAEPLSKGAALEIIAAPIYINSIANNSTMVDISCYHRITSLAYSHEYTIKSSLIAQKGCHITLGVKANRTEVGYGYIKSGE